MSKADWTIWGVLMLLLMWGLALNLTGCSSRPSVAERTYQRQMEKLYPPAPPEFQEAPQEQLP